MQVVSIDYLKANGLLIVDKKQFLDLLIEVNVKNSIDKRVKWIDRKTAIAKYGVTRYWLDAAEKDVYSMLQVSVGKTKSSPKKYLESSLIDEQQRRSECI
jgi:hypothetical protein